MYIIDRFEGEFAICEDENKQMHPIKICDLPKETKEGDCIKMSDGKFIVDADETKSRKEKVRKLMSSLFED